MKSKVEEIYLTVSIDTECDHDAQWIRSKPLAFESINRGLPEILQPAFMEVGAIPTYLVTVEVLEDKRCVETLKTLQGEFELGTHMHAAFVEPQKKFFDYAGVDSPDFQCNYPPEIEFQKLATITRQFEDALGYKPTSFRAGRFGASADTVDSLQKLGYLVDTSVTPRKKWIEPKGAVDFRRAPEQPYFPAADSIAEKGVYTDGRLLEVPVTIKPRFARRHPKWFRPWFASVEEMKSIFRYQLKKHANQRVLTMNMMFHSMEIIPEASPYPQTEAEVARFVDDMQQALQWCAAEGAQFSGLTDLYSAFKPKTDGL